MRVLRRRVRRIDVVRRSAPAQRRRQTHEPPSAVRLANDQQPHSTTAPPPLRHTKAGAATYDARRMEDDSDVAPGASPSMDGMGVDCPHRLVTENMWPGPHRTANKPEKTRNDRHPQFAAQLHDTVKRNTHASTTSTATMPHHVPGRAAAGRRHDSTLLSDRYFTSSQEPTHVWLASHRLTFVYTVEPRATSTTSCKRNTLKNDTTPPPHIRENTRTTATKAVQPRTLVAGTTDVQAVDDDTRAARGRGVRERLADALDDGRVERERAVVHAPHAVRQVVEVAGDDHLGGRTARCTRNKNTQRSGGEAHTQTAKNNSSTQQLASTHATKQEI